MLVLVPLAMLRVELLILIMQSIIASITSSRYYYRKRSLTNVIESIVDGLTCRLTEKYMVE